MTFAAVQKHPRYRLNAPVDVVTASAEIEQAAAENISLGGIFIRTTTPPPMGSPVRLRLKTTTPGGQAEPSTIGLFGKVVHIVDAELAAAKSLPMGIGIQFEALPPKTEEVLRTFVTNLAAQAEREKALLAPARFANPAIVQVKTPRVVLQQLWDQSLKHGGLFAAGDPPPLGSVVRVLIGPLELTGEVVHIDHAADGARRGAGLQIRDLEGAKREALVRFLDGSVDVLFYRDARFHSAPVAKVLSLARRLFLGIEENEPLAGVGLLNTATADEVKARVQQLRTVFQTPPEDATPPQLARLEAALRALDHLEPSLLARVAPQRQATREAAPVSLGDRKPTGVWGAVGVAVRDAPGAVPHRAPSSRFIKASAAAADIDAVRALLQEANDHERKSERAQARKALVKALELAPDDVAVQQRLAAVDAALDLARALDLLAKAEVFIQGVGMKDQAIENANEAARISSHREVRLRAVRVLAKSGDLAGATQLAEDLLDVDARDQHALQALVILYEKTERWKDAARTGEHLLRLKPDDSELEKRLKKIVDNARRAPGTPSTRIPSGRWSLTK